MLRLINYRSNELNHVAFADLLAAARYWLAVFQPAAFLWLAVLIGPGSWLQAFLIASCIVPFVVYGLFALIHVLWQLDLKQRSRPVLPLWLIIASAYAIPLAFVAVGGAIVLFALMIIATAYQHIMRPAQATTSVPLGSR